MRAGLFRGLSGRQRQQGGECGQQSMSHLKKWAARIGIEHWKAEGRSEGQSGLPGRSTPLIPIMKPVVDDGRAGKASAGTSGVESRGIHSSSYGQFALGGSGGEARPTFQFQAILPVAWRRHMTSSFRLYMPGIKCVAGCGASVKSM